ncbi:MAG: AEC family transporter [Oscillospiraceae bacterium]|nr:AEC family transporter [Oscillospiraceae bacterium]
MNHFLLTINAIVPMFLLVGAGFVSRTAGIISREEVPQVNKLAYRVFLPCMLFYSIYQSDLNSVFRMDAILFAALGFFFVAFVSVLSCDRLVKQQEHKGVIAQSLYRSNFLILGLPIAAALLPDNELGLVTILMALMGPLFNVTSVVVLERYSSVKTDKKEMLLAVLKNPLIVGTILGLLTQLVRLRLPALLEGVLLSLGSVASPLQLFLLGAFFRFEGLKRYLKPLIVVTILKLCVIPGLLLGTAALIGFRGAAFVGILGAFASPTAVNSFTMVQQMECGDAELAGDLVVVTTAFSLFSFFVWVLLFKTLGMF